MTGKLTHPEIRPPATGPKGATGPLPTGARRDSMSVTGTHRSPSSSAAPTPSAAFSDRTSDSSLSAPRRISTGDFNSAMIHLYRGEVQRSNTWRSRLDTTTNWAVITAGATLSFAFSAPENPHFVILINSLVVAFFLFMEARRYRYYEIWSGRVRVLETGYFAQVLHPERKFNDNWAQMLADELLTPHFTISEWEAVGRRLRRNYLWIFILLAMAWNLKVYLHPRTATDFDEFILRAAVGIVPGDIVFAIGVVFNAALFIFALATIRLRQATGEVLPEHDFSLPTFARVADWRREAKQRRATTRRAARARERTRTTSQATSEHRRSDTGEWKRADLSQKVEESEGQKI
jgi:uncharacterized membrane protein